MAAFLLLGVLAVCQGNAAVISVEIDSAEYRLAVYSGKRSVESPQSIEELPPAPTCISFTEGGRKFATSFTEESSGNATVCGFFPYFRAETDPFEGKLMYSNYWFRTREGKFSTEINGEVHSSEELVAMLLEHIRKGMEERFPGQKLEFAIVVPVYWTRTQRIALLQVAETVKMTVLCLPHRATSAALLFGFSRFDNETAHIGLVFDLAEDGLEAALVRFNATNKKTQRTKNVESIEMMGNSYSRRVGSAVIDYSLAQAIAGSEGTATQARLRAEIREGRQSLAKKDSVRVGGSRELRYTALREEVDKRKEDVIDTVQRALEAAEVAKGSVDSLILVGRSAHSPAVQDLLQDFFPATTQSHFQDESAVGAALIAANRTSQYRVKPVWLADLSQNEIKVEFLNTNDGFNKSLVLFPQGTKLGAKRQLAFTYDKSVKCVLSLGNKEEMTPFLSIAVSGAEEFARKYKQRPSQVFTFLYEETGVAGLKWAEVRGEVWEANTTAEKKAPESSQPLNSTSEGNSTSNSTLIRKAVSAALELSYTELDVPPPLSASDMKLIVIRLHELASRDHASALRLEAKEKLISGIRTQRELLREKKFLRVVTEDEKKGLASVVQEAEDWVHSEEAKTVESWTLTEKLQKLQGAFREAQERMDESAARPQAIRNAQSRIAQLNATMRDLNLTKTWVPQKDRDEVFSRLAEVKEWLNRVEQDHRERQPWENPLAKVSQIASKVSGAAKNVERIQKTPRPKPKILKEKKETVSESTAGDGENMEEDTEDREDTENERQELQGKQWEECKGDDCDEANVPREEL